MAAAADVAKQDAWSESSAEEGPGGSRADAVSGSRAVRVRPPQSPSEEPGGRGAPGAPSFSELLEQLAAEHAREVTELREAVRLLKSRPHGATCGLCGDAPESIVLAGRSAVSEREGPGSSLSGRSLCRVGSSATWLRTGSGDSMGGAGVQFYVVIQSARGLRNADWRFGDKSDPYCVCEVPGKPQWTCHTAVVNNDLSPKWNHTFVITGHSPSDDLYFTIMDKDWGTGDELLGRACLMGHDLHEKNGFDGELRLEEAGDGVEAWLKVKVSAVPMQVQNPTFNLHPAWLVVPENLRGRTAACLHTAVARFFDESSTARLDEMRTYQDMPKPPVCVLHPESTKRMAWDFAGLFVLLADLIWIPMQVFDPPSTTGTQVLAWVAMLYWTMDVVATLNSGYYTKAGIVVMERRRILKKYAMTWMPLDIALVSIDWAMAIDNFSAGAPAGTGVARSAKLARAARVIRLLRLMRLAKLRKILFTVQSIIDSEWVTIVFAVVKNLMTMLAVNHLLACAWFAIGSAGRDGWVYAEGVVDKGVGFQYVVSLNWSLAQFTPGASPIRPRSLAERYFSVMVLALGLVMATCFMSSITSTMASVWTLNRYNCTQHVLLKKFMKQNKVSRALGSRINRYVDFMLSSRLQRVHATKVHFLALLSGPLHIELQTELFGPQLSNHPCFQQISVASKPVLREMCATAVETTNFAKNDMLFLGGKEAKLMWFLTLGSSVYRYRVNRHRPSVKVRLDTGSWFVEVALWMPWQHVGEMKALTEVDIVSVIVSKFREIVTNHRDIYLLVRTYAFKFRHDAEQEWSADPNFMITDIPLKVMESRAGCSRRTSFGGGLQEEVAVAEVVQAQIVSWDDADTSEDPLRS